MSNGAEAAAATNGSQRPLRAGRALLRACACPGEHQEVEAAALGLWMCLWM